MLDNKDMQGVVNNYGDPIASFKMSAKDFVLRPYCNFITGAFTITLPSVAEAKGSFYSIIARQADGINFITIVDRRDSEGWEGNIILSANGARAIFYSDGLAWYPLMVGTTEWPGVITTIAPTSAVPTTSVATTLAPTTVVPTTVVPTTVTPTTVVPTTVLPTTVLPPTVAPTTAAPTTVAPTTPAPMVTTGAP
jgi:hypothetical protein